MYIYIPYLHDVYVIPMCVHKNYAQITVTFSIFHHGCNGGCLDALNLAQEGVENHRCLVVSMGEGDLKRWFFLYVSTHLLKEK